METNNFLTMKKETVNQIKTYDFYRIENTTVLNGIPILGMFGTRKDRWYIDLPEWQGPRANLEMVMGADVMLDVLSSGNERVNVTFSNHATSEFDAELKLTHLSNGDYTVTDLTNQYTSVPDQIWLCGVTQFVFQSDYPQEIYLKRNMTVS
jgi:hypothetical protein